MNASIALDNLSFESGEVFNDEILAKDAVDTDLMSPVHEEPFNNMLTVFDTYSSIVDRRYVCRGDMERIKGLAPQYPALNELVEQYPVNSFTLEPSKVNYDVSLEGFARTAYEAVVKALRDILDFIIKSFKRLWQFMRSDTQRTQAVDDVAGQLVAIQNYILEVDKIASSTRFSAEFQRVKEGAFKSEAHNLYKWNNLKNNFMVDPAASRAIFNTINDVLRAKTPPFVDAVSAFLTALTEAESESEINTAIAQMELLDMTSAQLTTLTAQQGYSTRGTQINPKMTNFQSMSSFMLNTLRSAENDRTQANIADFSKAIVTFTVDEWSGAMNETIAFNQSKVDPILKRLESFNEGSLKPGLEDVYIQKLTPFFTSLTSILQGFTALENAMGMLTANRNNVTIAISKAALNIVKSMDKFVMSKKDELTLAEQSVIARHRKALNSKFK